MDVQGRVPGGGDEDVEGAGEENRSDAGGVRREDCLLSCREIYSEVLISSAEGYGRGNNVPSNIII